VPQTDIHAGKPLRNALTRENKSSKSKPIWRILVQDIKSLRYLTASNAWDSDESTARCFARIHVAAEYCATHEFKDVHIVLSGGTTESYPAAKTILRLPLVRARRSRETGTTLTRRGV
jgi:hypothetical protein